MKKTACFFLAPFLRVLAGKGILFLLLFLTDSVVIHAFPDTVWRYPDQRKYEMPLKTFTRNGKTIEILQTRNGRLKKRMQEKKPASHFQKLPSIPLSVFPSFHDDEIPPSTLFESFEDYDSTQIWLPENWTWESKTGIQRNNPDYITWFTSSDFLDVRPSDGKYSEWINFSIEQLQDEWLISPSFVPQAHDTLFFDANFSPFWMLLNMETLKIDFEHPASLLQAMISTDDGKNWTSLWLAIDAYRDYDYDELMEYFLESEWHEIKITLEEYVGQTVKIAFRYEGLFGDNNGLDRISVSRERPFTSKAPAASYDIPEGFFMTGLTPEGNGVTGVMFAPAYLPVVWRNTSFDAKQFHWEMPTVFEMGSYISSEENPMERYIQDGYYFPVLTVNWEDKVSEPYSWSGEATDLSYGKAVFFAGGNINDHIKIKELKDLGLGNFNLINGITSYAFEEGNYLFGTRPDHSVDAIANYFQKPAQDYILKGVNIAVSNFQAPAGTTFELIIHRSDENHNLLDTIATSQWISDKAIAVPDFYNIGFKTGELLVCDALIMELKGFNRQAGVSLSCFSEVLHDDLNHNNAYLFEWQNGKRILLKPSDILQSSGATSLCFSLNLTYSFIGPLNLEYTFTSGPQKEEKTVDMTGYYPAGSWTIVNPVPQWLNVTIVPESNENAIPHIRFVTDDLPEGIEKQYVDISICDTKGGDYTFRVIQDLFSGIKPPESSRLIEVRNLGNGTELIYPDDYFKSLQVYNVSGQKVGFYPLPASGKFILPASALKRGVYFLQFTGKMTETVKVIR
ncbi:MAG: T9SS type A sorting domain-containing protein [Dysgonamonadaceae bacterium]|jgi:hypothetical protein|nr:T9SS type A sorting domain-containing protein [Dysgonamonadaceae bacterium]